MAKTSAGVLLYKLVRDELQVLLVHPGGPFWTHKDRGAWTIPKGEPTTDDEDYLATARRELHEETGFTAAGNAISLGHIRQSGGKTVHAWAVAGEVDATGLRSNSFALEWPRGSKNMQSFPEVDKARWFQLHAARQRINPAQAILLDRLTVALQRVQ